MIWKGLCQGDGSFQRSLGFTSVVENITHPEGSLSGRVAPWFLADDAERMTLKKSPSPCVGLGDREMGLGDRKDPPKRSRPLLGEFDHGRPDSLVLMVLDHSDCQNLGDMGPSPTGFSDDHHEESNRLGTVLMALFGHIGVNALLKKEVGENCLVITIDRESLKREGADKGEIAGKGFSNSYGFEGLLGHGRDITEARE